MERLETMIEQLYKKVVAEKELRVDKLKTRIKQEIDMSTAYLPPGEKEEYIKQEKAKYFEPVSGKERSFIKESLTLPVFRQYILDNYQLDKEHFENKKKSIPEESIDQDFNEIFLEKYSVLTQQKRLIAKYAQLYHYIDIWQFFDRLIYLDEEKDTAEIADNEKFLSVRRPTITRENYDNKTKLTVKQTVLLFRLLWEELVFLQIDYIIHKTIKQCIQSLTGYSFYTIEDEYNSRDITVDDKTAIRDILNNILKKLE